MDKQVSNLLEKEFGVKNRIMVYVLAVPILGGIIIAIFSLIMMFWGDTYFWLKVFGTSGLIYIVSALFYQKYKNDYKEERYLEIKKGSVECDITTTGIRKSKFQQRLDDYMEHTKKPKL